MSEIELLVLGRVVERVLIVLICGASLGFGWNLFREGIVKDQQAEFSKGQWKVALKQVGPGVFFALFACVGLVFAVTSPLTLGKTPDPREKGHAVPLAAGVVANYDAPEGIDAATADEIKAINTLTSLWRSDRSSNAPKPEIDAGDQASQILRQRKETLLQASFQQEYTHYKDIRSKVGLHPEILGTLSKEQRAQYDQIDRLNDDNFMNPSSH
jgi:hypothetical protein